MPLPKLAIVGGSSTWELAPFDDLSVDIWAFNNKGTHYPRLTALIDIHDREEQERQGHVEWMRKATIPVYTKYAMPDIPSGIVYPFKDAYALTKNVLVKGEELKYFTSSIPYAIALAILQGRKNIYLYGFEMKNGTEYKNQRECLTFWVGFAAGRGTKIEINCGSNIFKKPLY